MKNIFTDHPNSIGETYFQHLRYAFAFGFRMVVGGLACILHAIFPWVFERTGSDILLNEIKKWVKRMTKIDGRILEVNKLIEEKMKNDSKG